MNYKIYTDGSYRSSLSQGGVGIVWLKDDKFVQEYSKTFKNTTNNQMELIAIYFALKSIKNEVYERTNLIVKLILSIGLLVVLSIFWCL